MCGRFTNIMTWAELHALYSIHDRAVRERGDNNPARYNIAPTQTIDFARIDENGERILDEGRWGLVPSWFKEIKGAPLINARSEGVATNGAFKKSFAGRRCLIPASGYYEWTSIDGGKTRDPWFIHMPDTVPFSFAGLWDRARVKGQDGADLEVTSCTIITASSEGVGDVEKLHDRIPVILDRSNYADWLDPATGTAQALELLTMHINDQLTFWRVDRRVNSSRYEAGPEAIEPIDLPPLPATEMLL